MSYTKTGTAVILFQSQTENCGRNWKY